MPNCSGTFSLHKGILICSYCGSITVEDAIKFLKQPGTRFSGTDWKYAWPHKFYIEPINPEADKLVHMGSRTHREDGTKADGTGPGEYWTCRAHGDHLEGNTCTCPKDAHTGNWNIEILGNIQRIHYKFYNAHLNDVSDELLKEFGELSLKIFGIFWGRDDKGVFYRSPKSNTFYGYQRAGIVDKEGNVVRQL